MWWWKRKKNRKKKKRKRKASWKSFKRFFSAGVFFLLTHAFAHKQLFYYCCCFFLFHSFFFFYFFYSFENIISMHDYFFFCKIIRDFKFELMWKQTFENERADKLTMPTERFTWFCVFLEWKSRHYERLCYNTYIPCLLLLISVCFFFFFMSILFYFSIFILPFISFYDIQIKRVERSKCLCNCVFVFSFDYYFFHRSITTSSSPSSLS